MFSFGIRTSLLLGLTNRALLLGLLGLLARQHTNGVWWCSRCCPIGITRISRSTSCIPERRNRRIREMARRVMLEQPPNIWFDFDSVRRFARSQGMPEDEAREVQDLFWT